jgi:hypothetical protein
MVFMCTLMVETIPLKVETCKIILPSFSITNPLKTHIALPTIMTYLVSFYWVTSQRYPTSSIKLWGQACIYVANIPNKARLTQQEWMCS